MEAACPKGPLPQERQRFIAGGAFHSTVKINWLR